MIEVSIGGEDVALVSVADPAAYCEGDAEDIALQEEPHCRCWYDESPCCRCGYDGDDGDEETACPGA